jgi:DNA-binding transcriptional ArsR family regulator
LIKQQKVGVFEALADPVRRRIAELLADGEQPAGRLGEAVQREFGISQPGASQHLRVLRDHGVVLVRAEGVRRIYALDPRALAEIDHWLDRFRRSWEQQLDALATELARGQRAQRQGRGRRAAKKRSA